jgi:hypothetical protein
MRHAEDQRCETEEGRTYLHHRKDNDHANYVTIYVERNGPRTIPAIHLGVAIDVGVTLTPAGARRLGRSSRKMMARLARVL